MWTRLSYSHLLDLASVHVVAPDSTTFDNCPGPARLNAYNNLARGQGFSVLQIVEAMREETGFNYRYNIIGRRYVESTLLFLK
jgi:UDP-glucose 4-epimerase